jgi:hypothetical protein
MNGAPNGDAGPAGRGSPEPASTAAPPPSDERTRLVKAAALGFVLGLLLVRWGGSAFS